jgi:hypothetical protein
MTINEKLSKIQVEFKSKKSRFNSFGKYYFRSADDTQDSDATNTHGKATAAKQTMTNESLAKAKEYINKGGSLDAIKAKYVVTKKHEEMLTL